MRLKGTACEQTDRTLHRPVGRPLARRPRAECASWGYDGLELACWGITSRSIARSPTPATCAAARELLERHGLGCWALGAHLVGQAVCDPIDARHRAILPPDVWGDGEPEGVRSRAAARMKDTARAAAAFGVTVVTGFTGSSIWHQLYSFPPNDWAAIERGYEDFAERWGADHRRLRRRGGPLRARGPPDRDRLRPRHDPAGARRDRPSRGVRHQPRPEPLHPAAPRSRRVRAWSSPTGSTTSTSRTRR